ncbi:SDR family NAD(P)-dependent oxidoreductase [Rhodococcus koreensis]|uniref:SDR family NAD(P)-dependent oxidoreductase n=1 Tax=Rhodococcus koreensis TaxID=99653 RepID=UPI0036DF1157
MKDLFDLTGKVALVTGGSRGIGRTIAGAFAEAGADVVIASRKADACVLAAKEISEATGRRALGLGCHVGKWDDCDALISRVYDEFGRCDVLVNNAGMSPKYQDLASITEDYYDKVSSVNLKGPFRLSAAIGTRMAAGEGGSIINVSTIGSTRPGANELVYACAKAGLNALTIGTAEAFGPTVRANAILPGSVMTDISHAWTPEFIEMVSDVPAGRPGQPEDFIGTALWLATAASAFVTGAIIRVDGGAFRQM